MMNKAYSAAKLLTICVFAATTATGCFSNNDDLEQFIAETKRIKGKAPKPFGKVVTYESYAYPDTPPRDPFEQLNFAQNNRKIAASNSAIKPNIDRPKEDLEKFPLDALRMVGTLEKDNKTWALIKEPGSVGVIHRVTIGNHLGLSYGQVTDVSETAVAIREIVSDGGDGWKYQDALIALSE